MRVTDSCLILLLVVAAFIFIAHEGESGIVRIKAAEVIDKLFMGYIELFLLTFITGPSAKEKFYNDMETIVSINGTINFSRASIIGWFNRRRSMICNQFLDREEECRDDPYSINIITVAVLLHPSPVYKIISCDVLRPACYEWRRYSTRPSARFQLLMSSHFISYLSLGHQYKRITEFFDQLAQLTNYSRTEVGNWFRHRVRVVQPQFLARKEECQDDPHDNKTLQVAVNNLPKINLDIPCFLLKAKYITQPTSAKDLKRKESYSGGKGPGSGRPIAKKQKVQREEQQRGIRNAGNTSFEWPK